MPTDVPSENIEVWFQDEARVGQRGTVTRIWARRGTRPRVIRQQQFEYAYIFGAVCPMKDQAVGLIMPSIGTACMQQHLNEISKQVDSGNHAVVVFDQAAWHTTKNFDCPKTFLFCRFPQHLRS